MRNAGAAPGKFCFESVLLKLALYSVALIRIQGPQAFAITAVIVALPSSRMTYQCGWYFKQQDSLPFELTFMNSPKAQPVGCVIGYFLYEALQFEHIRPKCRAHYSMSIGYSKNQPRRINTL